MRPEDLGTGAMVCSVLAACVSGYVAIHEYSYAGSHPYAVGPANVIALGGIAGVLIAAAVFMIALAVRRSKPR
jgi:hypothetical protein